MSKAYIQVKSDIADAAAFATFIAANPTHFKLGTHVVVADGTEYLVQDNAGTYVTIGVSVVAASTAEHGAGVIGTAATPTTRRWFENGGVIVTQITFDITGLGVVGTAANDVIGLVAGGVAYLGRNVVATNGVIFKAHMSCIEAAAGSATITQDIDIATNASAVLEYDGAAGSAKLINGATMVEGQGVENLVPATTANDYFYIVEGDTAATTGVYTAGQYVLTIHGHAVLS